MIERVNVRRLRLFAAAVIVAPVLAVGPTPALAAKPKKPPATKPKVEAEPAPDLAPDAPKPKTEKARLEIAACPPEDLAQLEAAALVTFLEKRCRNLKVPETSAPTEIADDEMLVALCTRKGDSGREAIEPKECGLEASVHVDSGKTLKLGADGDLALALRTAKLGRDAALSNGTTMTLVVAGAEKAIVEDKPVRSPLVWRRPFEAYGNGRVVWFPLPMFTTDLSSSPGGYRIGVTPVAVALGWKWFPSGSSRGYVGASAFAAWNLLVPNDTQTLSNGTTVRINYQALGAGLLLDASGWFAIGAGVGRTFTTDSRTDFRMWLYFGPRLLSGLNEL